MRGLPARDVSRLDAALEALLDPLSGDADGWRGRVNPICRELLRGDCASFLLPLPGMQWVYTKQFPQETARRYPALMRVNEQRYGLITRQIRLGVWNRRLEYGPHYDRILRSPYYQDYLVPVRAFDAIGLTMAAGGPGEYASLMLHHDHPTRRRFGRRGLTILRLLFPAFRAGVDSFMRLASARQRLAATIDDLGEPMLVLSAQGRVLHRTPALQALLRLDPQAELLVTTAEVAARDAASRDGASEIERRARSAERTVTTRRGTYTIRITRAPEDLGGSPTLLALLAQGETAPPALGAAAAERLGLTAQEARVAALLVERRSNREIADSLVISPHTARHHTESVLRKLGIHSRKDVPAALRRADA